jgi:hypothetical protein
VAQYQIEVPQLKPVANGGIFLCRSIGNLSRGEENQDQILRTALIPAFAFPQMGPTPSVSIMDPVRCFL